MATTRSDKQVVRVFVSLSELATLLGNQAQQAGFINFAPSEVEMFPSEEESIDPDNNVITTQGWEVVFMRDIP